jgi:16S rRNA (cytidine1402-2'-O)-methyltransferase
MKNRLIIGAMPIGNLEDISIRMLKIIKNSDLIICEKVSTFQNFALQGKWEYTAKLIEYTGQPESFYLHKYILEEIMNGKNVLFVCEWGMPSISDPGPALFNFLIENNQEIFVIPGPSIIPASYTASVSLNDSLNRGGITFKPFFHIDEKLKFNVLTELEKDVNTIIILEKDEKLLELFYNIEKIFNGNRKINICIDIGLDSQNIVRTNVKNLLSDISKFDLSNKFITTVIDGKL